MKKSISITISPKDLMMALQKSTTNGDGDLEIFLTGVKDHIVCTNDIPALTPDDYERWDKLVKKYGINLKDIREIIMLACSWWERYPLYKEEEIIEYYFERKDKFRDHVYTGELIYIVLNAISKCKDPVSDFYSRMYNTNNKNFSTFEEFLKEAYTNEID